MHAINKEAQASRPHGLPLFIQEGNLNKEGRKSGMLRSYLFLPSCLPYLNNSFRLLNALAGSANPHGLSLNKGARASRPHLQSILAGRMPHFKVFARNVKKVE